MTRSCPRCRAVSRPGLRFCTLCGSALAPVAEHAPGPGPAARPATARPPTPDPVRPTTALELPAARLVVIHENELVEELLLRETVVTIGRDPANDVVVATNRASVRHARMVYREGQFWIEDLGSANGTQLDGDPVREARPLRSGSIIKVGTSLLKFVAGPEYR